MSSTNCFLPRSGFCLNLRVRIVNSGIARGCVLLAFWGGEEAAATHSGAERGLR